LRLIVLSGPPSSGKTSVLRYSLGHLIKEGKRAAVVKLDCLVGGDEKDYKKSGIECVTGLSGFICPDHYLATNIDRIIAWGRSKKLDFLVIESAGLCNRCSPHLEGVLAVSVMDMLSGMNTPRKVGPLLKSADIVILTRGDIISQTEREVFRVRVSEVNRKARVLEVNGLTGQRTLMLAKQMKKAPVLKIKHKLQLRYPMPSAVCSFCLGERRVGEEFAGGNVKLMELPEKSQIRKKKELEV
jgi:Ni2+-binding GTPase involved in maturation of urease and hydrogenase